MHVNLDPQLVDKIANEVKSQGVFDQFRKDSMADVDTKPAYQNLRQRVENTVNKFLSEQRWTPELNKNHLRERLRKHITEAGFLDVGVERIVDQVVNPKIATVFQPKIEDIAYTYLGIPKPQAKIVVSEGIPFNGILQIETDLMPTDLEQVSPDSDKGTVKSDSKDEMETDDKIDDFESPAFEPIEISNFSHPKFDINSDYEEKPSIIVDVSTEAFSVENDIQVKDESPMKYIYADVKLEEASDPRKLDEDREANISGEATQESQLSQVSSDSRLSIVMNENTQDEQSIACEIKEANHVNISEEAQMPKFNENSNSASETKTSEPLHFDIKKDEIKFEGTERKIEQSTEALSPNTSDEQRMDSSLENKSIDNSQTNDIPLPSHEYSFEKDNDFKFSKIEVEVDLEEVTKTTSLDDSVDRQLHIIEKSEMSQCSVSQQSVKSPLVKHEKPSKSPSATSSPSHLHKSNHRDKELSSSSSRHKKHSKDRRSDKDRDKHSSSGHKLSSSSSYKYHSSSKPSSSQRVAGSSSDRRHDHHRSSSSSLHKSKHSSRNGRTSRSHHESKDSRSHDHSKSSSEKPKEKSSKERSDRSKLSDDHYSSKHKWRKSTDDEDSSQEGTRAGLPKDNSNSRDNATNGTPNNSSTSSGNSTTNNATAAAGGSVDTQATANSSGQKIVILDNLLKNPKTNFIEIGDDHFQVNSNVDASTKISDDADTLYYFEDDNQRKTEAANRIKMMTKIMENFRNILQTNFDFPRKLSTTESESTNSNESERNQRRQESLSPSGCAIKRRFGSPSEPPSLTSATLTIDCIQYGNTTTSHCLSKRFKFTGTQDTKVSPTPSELSANSKENEFIDKNTQSDSEFFRSQNSTKSVLNKVIVAKRKAIVSQRYSSEDLYKPRPILSQRSRRRGLDAVI